MLMFKLKKMFLNKKESISCIIYFVFVLKTLVVLVFHKSDQHGHEHKTTSSSEYGQEEAEKKMYYFYVDFPFRFVILLNYVVTINLCMNPQIVLNPICFVDNKYQLIFFVC